MSNLRYNNEEFILILKDYQEKVKLGLYEKTVPYKTWEDLKKSFSIDIEFMENILYVSTLTLTYSFSIDDKGFGSYIFNNFFGNSIEACNVLKIDENGLLYAEEEKEKERKENETMKNFNFDFGPCTDNNIRMSMYGIAVKNTSGTWVSYNSKTQEVVDVDILNFNGGKYMYKIPVAVKDVAIGDVIIHARKPMFVVEISQDRKTLTVVDVCEGEKKSIIPTVNIFGFNFCIKVVSLFDIGTPTADSPFGNMLPLMLLGDNKDIDPLALMFMMNQKDNNMFSNPMMMYFMMKDKREIDPIVLMMAMNNNNKACSCECKSHNE